MNKRDALAKNEAEALSEEFPEALMISALDKRDLKKLRDKILVYFEKDMKDEEIFIPYTAKGVVGEVRAKLRVLSETYDESGVKFKVRGAPSLISLIRKKLS